MFSLIALFAIANTYTRVDCPCDPDYMLFNKKYNKYPSDEGCKNFCQVFEQIKSHNNDPRSTYRVEIKSFHDKKSFHSTGYLPSFRNKSSDVLASHSDFTQHSYEHINWFEQGRVTDVRNQGSCGDCWAESAVGVLESLYQQQYGYLMQLSVQQAAECPSNERDSGCEGGWPIDVLTYVKNVTGGLCSEKSYPTIIGNNGDVSCNVSESRVCNIPIAVNRILSIPTGDESILESAVKCDVVSVAIDASGTGFASYSDGIYNGMFNGEPDCSQTSLDHAVVVIGLGVRLKDNTPYYLVRNSWGVEGWGNMNGYILFLRGNNTCGIAQDAVCVTM